MVRSASNSIAIISNCQAGIPGSKWRAKDVSGWFEGLTMQQNKEGWGAVLGGEAADIDDWTHLLSNGLDPWTETNGNDTILRSNTLSNLESADEVRAQSSDMIDYLNGAMALSQGCGSVTFRAAIRFDSKGHVHRTVFGEMGAFERKDRMRGTGEVLNANGNLIPAVPTPSEVQNWAAIAENDSLIQEALTYFRKSPTWFNIYKALECLTLRFGGDEAKFLELNWESRAEIKLLKRSANTLRHAKRRFDPPEKPMTLSDANALLSNLLRRALTEAQANPRDEASD
jgi:hypothetical protein